MATTPENEKKVVNEEPKIDLFEDDDEFEEFESEADGDDDDDKMNKRLI
ncbi:hypothetical protein AMTRI_Chr13g85900 [Amborella trichopoda]